MKIAGWKEVPVDTTIGRIMKIVTQGDIVELTGVIHRFRGKVWKRAVRSGQKWEAVKGNAGWEQSDFWYQCAEWNRARRFVAVRQLTKLVPVKTGIEKVVLVGLINHQ